MADKENVGPNTPGSQDSQESEEVLDPSVIRQRYRVLMDDVAHKEKLAGSGTEWIGNAIDTTNSLFSMVETAQEAVLDACVLRQVARICRQNVEEMSTNITRFHVEEYAEKLIHNMNGSFDNERKIGQASARKWSALGSAAQTLFARPPPLHYLFGCLPSGPLEPKAKKPRQRREVDSSQLVETKFEHVASATRTGGPQTEELVISTFQQLVKMYNSNGRVPIGYFNFVIDPDCFGTTVENMFHVSFLVKECKVAIWVDENSKLPVIKPLSKKVAEAADGSNKNQVVMNITMKHWKKLKTSLNITEPGIKHDEVTDGKRQRTGDH